MNIYHIINNMYYNNVGIITIFLLLLCPLYNFRNNVDYIYKYSLTWKFPEQVNNMSGVYVLIAIQ